MSTNEVVKAIYGKNKAKEGISPAVALINPKYPHNVGTVKRACSCFNVKQLWYTGNRVPLDAKDGYRLPREERMKGYANVEIRNFDYFFDQFDKDVTPVAVELRPNSEILTNFHHPEKPLYVFGPEDGSIPQVMLQHCHRYVVIPTAHCTNLAAAVYIILYDRLLKMHQSGEQAINSLDEVLKEERGFIEPEYEGI